MQKKSFTNWLNKRVKSQNEKDKLSRSGFNPDLTDAAGFYFAEDMLHECFGQTQKGIEVLSIQEAFSRQKSFKKYFWNLIKPDKDQYTRAARRSRQGCFIRSLPNQKITQPVQSCMFIGTSSLCQQVHNIIIAEENSQLNVITGCLTNYAITDATHIGISEIYVGPNAKVTFTMIHNWGEHVKVRPRTATLVENNGSFVSNYICTGPVGNLQMAPVCHLKGEKSSAKYYSLLYAHPHATIDVGTKVFLQGKKSQTEIINKAISNQGTIRARGDLIGEAEEIKAHLECDGLIISKTGHISAIPKLEAKRSNVKMSHEAAIGKLSEDALEYLMARGLTKEKALSIIVRGFANTGDLNLPSLVQLEIDKLFDFEDNIWTDTL